MCTLAYRRYPWIQGHVHQHWVQILDQSELAYLGSGTFRPGLLERGWRVAWRSGGCSGSWPERKGWRRWWRKGCCWSLAAGLVQGGGPEGASTTSTFTQSIPFHSAARLSELRPKLSLHHHSARCGVIVIITIIIFIYIALFKTKLQSAVDTYLNLNEKLYLTLNTDIKLNIERKLVVSLQYCK